MDIAYFVQSTALYGGVKVIFRQAEAMARRGHRVAVVSPDPFPRWFEGEVEFIRAEAHELWSIHGWDWVIATYYAHIPILYELSSDRRRLWHLCQGYEGGWPEAGPNIREIEDAYTLPIPRFVISKELKRRMERLFPGRYRVIGQGIEHRYFYPPETLSAPFFSSDRIFLMGLYPASVKNLETALRALTVARWRRGARFRLVRITTSDTKREEEAIFGPIDEYYVSISPAQVGELLRRGGIMLCPNRAGEGFGLPAVEAMACGVPAVLSDIPSHRSIARIKDYAMFVDPESVEAMAEAVTRLLSDAALRARLAMRGLEVARGFRFGTVARRMEWWLRWEGMRNSLRWII